MFHSRSLPSSATLEHSQVELTVAYALADEFSVSQIHERLQLMSLDESFIAFVTIFTASQDTWTKTRHSRKRHAAPTEQTVTPWGATISI